MQWNKIIGGFLVSIPICSLLGCCVLGACIDDNFRRAMYVYGTVVVLFISFMTGLFLLSKD